MSFPFERRPDPAASAVRARILNALPSGGYQMDRFFQLLDLELSNEVPTASVLCGERPRLLLNPGFIEQYCTTDEHLFLLVMHELMHVVLGHTRLFTRPTLAHNIVFDAVINAMLCRQFPGLDYVGFFQATNDWQQFPARLLRPAPGWPHNPEPLPGDASDLERTVHARLYGADAKDVTYHEIFALLGEALSQNKGSLPMLLGSHGTGDHEDEAQNDATLLDVLRNAVAVWPAPFREIGRDLGERAREQSLATREPADPALELAIHRLFKRAGLKEAPSSRVRRRELGIVPVSFSTVVPQIGDRRARIRGALHHSPAVFYAAERTARRMIQRPVCRAFVYLDVSGSMNGVLPWLLAALREPVRSGVARLFVFSTIIEEVRLSTFEAARARSTGGTDLDCVLQHVLDLPRARCPRRIVVLTDGYVGAVAAKLRKQFIERRIEVLVGLPPPWYTPDVARLAQHIEKLPEPEDHE